jgi:hypothetical protein
VTPAMAEKVEKKAVKKVSKKLTAVDELTTEEREAVTIVFHQFETGLREGTIFTKVSKASLCNWAEGGPYNY